MKKFIIDGNNFYNWEGFTRGLYKQFEAEWFPFNISWLDDILYGGVVGFDEDEKVEFTWKNNLKSKSDLDKDRSINLTEEAIDKYGGNYGCIVYVIRSHKNISLRLDSEQDQK